MVFQVIPPNQAMLSNDPPLREIRLNCKFIFRYHEPFSHSGQFLFTITWNFTGNLQVYIGVMLFVCLNGNSRVTLKKKTFLVKHIFICAIGYLSSWMWPCFALPAHFKWLCLCVRAPANIISIPNVLELSFKHAAQYDVPLYCTVIELNTFAIPRV